MPRKSKWSRHTAEQAPEAQAGWRMPAELDRYVPRAVRLSAGGVAVVMCIVALVAGAIGSFTILYARGERNRVLRQRIETEGIRTKATVVEMGWTRGEHPRRVLVYRYSAGPHEYRQSVRLRRGDMAQVDIGSAVPARYLPEEPAASWLQGYEPTPVPTWVPFVVAPVPALGALALARLLASQRRLLSEGRAAEARILGSMAVSRAHRGRRYRTEYEFRTLSGAMRRAKCELVKESTAGTVLTVLYDRDNPQKNAVYPLSLVRVADPARGG